MLTVSLVSVAEWVCSLMLDDINNYIPRTE